MLTSRNALIDTVFKRLYRPLCLYAAHYLGGDLDAAEDIVQDCFVRLWQHGADDSRAFLYTAVRNASIDHLRRQHPEVVDFGPKDLDGIISDDEAQARSEEEAGLWAAIGSLPDRCRQIFLMSKRDGMTYADIAAELGLSVKTVEHQVSKALRRLRSDSSLSTLHSLLLVAF